MKDFKCNYCGKEYDTPEDMARCVIARSEKIKREEEEKRISYLEKEREVRKKEVKDAFDEFVRLLNKYDDDYNKTIFFRLNNTIPYNINNLFNLLDW